MKKIILASLLLAAAAVSVAAQEFRTGYFLENYTYSYRINAGAPIEGKPYFFAGLGLGNTTLETHTNLSVPSFLSPVTDENGVVSLVIPLATPEFTLEEALAGLSSENMLGMGLNYNLLTVGQQTSFNRWSVEINARTSAYLSAPLDVFGIAKTLLLNAGKDSWEWNEKFSFAGLHVGADAYTEIALGYSQKIGDMFTVGGRVKGLIGLAYVGIDLDASAAPTPAGTEKDVIAEVDGSFNIASPLDIGFESYQSGGKSYYNLNALPDFTNILNRNKKPVGWGLGFDLGVTFQPFEDLYITAAANDLGFMSWNGNLCGSWKVDSAIDFDNEEEYKSTLMRVENTSGRFSTGLNYSFNLGAKYKMPFYNRLSVGLLGTLQKNYKEARLGVDVTPLDFVSLAASAAVGSQGFNFGAALNLKFPIVNFFIGTDAFLFNFTPQMLPLDKLNTVITTGLLIAI